jgi:hypothetical protein
MCDSIPLDGARMVRPRWGVLYGATLSSLAVLAVVEVAAPPQPLLTMLRCGLALVTFVTMGTWVWSSRAALDLHDWCPCAPAKISMRVIESRRPAATPLPVTLDPLPAWSEERRELVHH